MYSLTLFGCIKTVVYTGQLTMWCYVTKFELY